MAELGIVASILQIADVGIRLSLNLYTFGETVASADRSIISVSKDVSLTSTVLKELGDTLVKDEASRICSGNAIVTANGIVQECLEVFKEIDAVLLKTLPGLMQGGERKARIAHVMERMKWPFVKGKIEFLRSNLERLKSTLVLMLNVISYARHVSEKEESSAILTEQRMLIEDLASSNEEYTRKFERLKLGDNEDPSNITGDLPHVVAKQSTPTAVLMAHSPVLNLVGNAKEHISTSPHTPSSRVQSWSQLEQTLHYYNTLMDKLLQEINLPQYRIGNQSRMRIREDIVNTHNREMRQVKETMNIQSDIRTGTVPENKSVQMELSGVRVGARHPTLVNGSQMSALGEFIPAASPVDTHQIYAHEPQQPPAARSPPLPVVRNFRNLGAFSSRRTQTRNTSYTYNDATAKLQQEAQICSDRPSSKASEPDANLQFSALNDANPDNEMQFNNDPDDSAVLEHFDFEQFVQGDAFNFDTTTFDINEGIEAVGFEDDGIEAEGKNAQLIAEDPPTPLIYDLNDNAKSKRVRNARKSRAPGTEYEEQTEHETDLSQVETSDLRIVDMGMKQSDSKPRKRNLLDAEFVSKCRWVSSGGPGDTKNSPFSDDFGMTERHSQKRLCVQDDAQVPTKASINDGDSLPPGRRTDPQADGDTNDSLVKDLLARWTTVIA